MPFCGRKFNGSGYIGSRWSSFLDLSHGRNIRHTSTHTQTHTPSNSHIPHPFKFLHQIYSTMEAEGSNWKVFICLGPQAPRVHIFPVLFFCLLLVSCRTCVCFSQAPVSSVFFFLAARLQDSHSPLVDLQDAGAAGWQIWCKAVEERSWWKINWCSAFANSSVYVCVCVGGGVCSSEVWLRVGGSAEGWVVGRDDSNKLIHFRT